MDVDPDTLWYQTSLDVFLNRWFSNYDQARQDRETVGGFLLPYKHHFFVCKNEVIHALGLDPDDLDWEKVQWDCARPADEAAYQRLRDKRAAIVLAAQPAQSTPVEENQ
jgi:hypothetical protein